MSNPSFNDADISGVCSYAKKSNNWNGEGKPSVGQMVCTDRLSQHIYEVMLPFNENNETCLKTTSSELFFNSKIKSFKTNTKSSRNRKKGICLCIG